MVRMIVTPKQKKTTLLCSDQREEVKASTAAVLSLTG
jgi:hypothetical protein